MTNDHPYEMLMFCLDLLLFTTGHTLPLTLCYFIIMMIIIIIKMGHTLYANDKLIILTIQCKTNIVFMHVLYNLEYFVHICQHFLHESNVCCNCSYLWWLTLHRICFLVTLYPALLYTNWFEENCAILKRSFLAFPQNGSWEICS